MTYLGNIVRDERDPKVLRSGPGSLSASDRLARTLGWFSLGLGLAELMAPRAITRALDIEGQEGVLRIFGCREMGAGILSLSTEKDIGLWSRVGGDVLDLGVLLLALRSSSKRGTIGLALAAVAGITLLDVAAARATGAGRRRPRGDRNKYRDRSGFPRGLAKSRGAAEEFRARRFA